MQDVGGVTCRRCGVLRLRNAGFTPIRFNTTLPATVASKPHRKLGGIALLSLRSGSCDGLLTIVHLL